MKETLRKNAFTIAAAISTLGCIYAYFNILLPLDVFLWDESHHTFYSMGIYDAITRLNLQDFWIRTNHQAMWMPVQSWLNAILFVLFGKTIIAARATSLLLFFTSSILIYLICKELSKDNGWLIGLIAVAIFNTSPGMLNMGTMNMQEMLGILGILATTFYFVKNIDNEREVKYLLTGLLIGGTYWFKQNFAYMVLMGIGMYQLSLFWDLRKVAIDDKPIVKEGNSKKKQKEILFIGNIKSNKYLLWAYNNAMIIAGTLPLLVLWWGVPPFDRKYALAISARAGTTGSLDFMKIKTTITTAIFYLQSLATSCNVSFWVGYLSVICLFTALMLFGDKKIRLISFMIYANLIFISIISFAQERYITTAAPLVFILFAYFAVLFSEKILANKTYRIVWLIIITFLCVEYIYDVSLLTSYTKEMANRSFYAVLYKEAYNESMINYDPPFCFGLIKRPILSIPIPRTYLSPIPTSLPTKIFNMSPKSSVGDVLNYFSSTISNESSVSSMISMVELSPYVLYWHFHDWKVPFFTLNDYGYAKQYFWRSDYFIDIEVDPASPYSLNVQEGHAKWTPAIKNMAGQGLVRLEKGKEFKDIGLTAKIYKRVRDF